MENEHHNIDVSGSYERVVCGPDEWLTQDGREIIRADGWAWALRPAVHARRAAEALECANLRSKVAAQAEPDTTTAACRGTCTTLIDGQLCGGILVKASVCPRCALGKSGVAATLTCDLCGHVSAVMRSDA